MCLSDADHQYLLKQAREAITLHLHGKEPPPVDAHTLPDSLSRKGACFVTLTKGGELRGCIGSLEPRQGLATDVMSNAINAAFKDPRFPPTRPEELEQLQIEVSILSAPQQLLFDGPDDLKGLDNADS